jgi:Tol biopolymer transport system component
MDIVGPSWATMEPNPLYFVPMLSWAPDGEWLAFGEKDSASAPARIMKVSLATLEKRPLTTPPSETLGDLEPQVSPDGRLLAFVRGHSRSYGNQEVWVQPLRGGEARRLTSGQYSRAAALSFTPGGSEVVFSDVVTSFSRGRIARVPLAGGAPEPVVGVGDNATQASVRGNRMVYVQETPTVMDAWRLPRPGTSLTASPTRLFGSSSNRAYSPDGRRIAFESNRGGSQSIWISEADGSRPAQLTTSKSYAGTPRWSPDSRRLAFDSLEAGNWDLYVIDADGGGPRRLTQEPSDDTTGTWSRDGRFIYFHSGRTGRDEIWKIPSDGGPATQVTRGGGFYAQESKDGRELYYSKSSPSGVWRVAVSGGAEVEVVREIVDWQNWALGRHGIYYATVRPHVYYRREEFTIHYVAFGSGRGTPLFREDDVAGHHWGLAVSPDERWLLFGKAPASQAELMLLENFR